MTTQAPPISETVANRVRDHAEAMTRGAKSGRDAALIRQATGEPQPMSKGELINLIQRAGQTPEDFDRETAELSVVIAARRLLAGRTRADVEAEDARLVEQHAEAIARVDEIVAEVDAKHAELRRVANETADAEMRFRIAKAKLANPQTPDDERADAQGVLDALDGIDPAPVAHRANAELVAFAANEHALNRRRNAAILAAKPGAEVLGEWRAALPKLNKALDAIESASPRIAGLAARVTDPKPEPEPTPKEKAEAWARREREHRQEIETVQTELAGRGKRASK